LLVRAIREDNDALAADAGREHKRAIQKAQELDDLLPD
jgi:hypothetical protein